MPSEASLDCGVRDTKAAALRQACSCAIAQALSRASSSASTPACSAEIGGTSGLMPAETESSLPSLQFHGLEEAPAAGTPRHVDASRVLEHHADEFNSWTVTVPQSYLARDCARAAVACRHRGTMAPQDETYVSVPIKHLPRNLCVTQVSSHLPMLLGGYLRFSGAVEVLCAP